MSEQSQQKGASIKRRRAGVRGWENRFRRVAMASAVRSDLEKPAVIIERKVLRTGKDFYLKYNPDALKEEVIEFWQAEFECNGRYSSTRMAEKLDAGETLETNKAFYTLHERIEIQSTVGERMKRSTEDLNRVINALKHCR